MYLSGPDLKKTIILFGELFCGVKKSGIFLAIQKSNIFAKKQKIVNRAPFCVFPLFKRCELNSAI